MDEIVIIRDKGTPIEQNSELETDGFLLVYTEKAKIKVTGDLNLRMFAPLIPVIMKFLAEKMKSS